MIEQLGRQERRSKGGSDPGFLHSLRVDDGGRFVRYKVAAPVNSCGQDEIISALNLLLSSMSSLFSKSITLIRVLSFDVDCCPFHTSGRESGLRRNAHPSLHRLQVNAELRTPRQLRLTRL